MQQAIFIVSGIPGAGKTTVSRLLAQRFERGVHIEADLLQKLIAAGSVWPDQEPADEAKRQLRLRGQHVCMLADSFFEAGFTTVIDDVVIGSRLEEFQADIRNRPLLFVVLAPRPDLVERRDSERTEKQVLHIWGHLDEALRKETPHVGLWIDSSDLTADETVDEIMQRAWPAAQLG